MLLELLAGVGVLFLVVCAFAGYCLSSGRFDWREWLAQTVHAQMSTWRLQAAKRPLRIILIRHGESQGNIDKTMYATVPDNKIQLTEKGCEQALEAGHRLKEIIGNESVLFMVSPFRRSQQTYELIAQSFQNNPHRMREDPRCREQEWGNFQRLEDMERILAEREVVGRFFYRFENGESGADVFDRVSSFMESLFRELDTQQPVQNIVIVSHGLFMRLFLTRFYRWPVAKFEALWNFRNCEHVLLEKHPVSGSYLLKTELRMDPKYQQRARSSFRSERDEPPASMAQLRATPSYARSTRNMLQEICSTLSRQQEAAKSPAGSEGASASPPGAGIDLLEQAEENERKRAHAEAQAEAERERAAGGEGGEEEQDLRESVPCTTSESPPQPSPFALHLPKPRSAPVAALACDSGSDVDSAAPTAPSSPAHSASTSSRCARAPFDTLSPPASFQRKAPSPMESVLDSSFALETPTPATPRASSRLLQLPIGMTPMASAHTPVTAPTSCMASFAIYRSEERSTAREEKRQHEPLVERAMTGTAAPLYVAPVEDDVEEEEGDAFSPEPPSLKGTPLTQRRTVAIARGFSSPY